MVKYTYYGYGGITEDNIFDFGFNYIGWPGSDLGGISTEYDYPMDLGDVIETFYDIEDKIPQNIIKIIDDIVDDADAKYNGRPDTSAAHEYCKQIDEIFQDEKVLDTFGNYMGNRLADRDEYEIEDQMYEAIANFEPDYDDLDD